MPKLSKDIPDAAEAIVALQELTTEKDVRDFIKGDEREAVMDAAVARINDLESPLPDA